MIANSRYFWTVSGKAGFAAPPASARGPRLTAGAAAAIAAA